MEIYIYMLSGLLPTLHERGQDLAARLQKRVADHDLEKLLEAGPARLNHVVREPIGEHLARQGRNRHPCALPLENVAEILKVAVPPTHRRLVQLEGRNVGSTQDLVVRVHGPPYAVRPRSSHLFVFVGPVSQLSPCFFFQLTNPPST